MTEMVSMVELKIPAVDKGVGGAWGEAHSFSGEGGKRGLAQVSGGPSSKIFHICNTF